LLGSLWLIDHINDQQHKQKALQQLQQMLASHQLGSSNLLISSPHITQVRRIPASDFNFPSHTLGAVEQARLQLGPIDNAKTNQWWFGLMDASRSDASQAFLVVEYVEFWPAYLDLYRYLKKGVNTELGDISPVVLVSGLTFQRVFLLILLCVILTGVAVYGLVYGFEISLQRLQRASSRIAHGHLNSRVKVPTDYKQYDAFARLGVAFNRMAEQIQRLMGVQREMIRAVSHELRTPVARMRFGIQILEDTTEDPKIHKQLHAMDHDLQELDELVDEILTYARLEEGGPILDFQRSNMLDLIQQIAEETRRRTASITVTISVADTQESAIFSDIEYRYLHRAIQNLVGNACRYAHSKVHIHYQCDEGVCRVDVEDDGDGIPENDWQRVFSPFMRLDDSRTRSSGGYGLGLSIVQRIIYWHGGKAMVGRSQWQGAKMSLIWPQFRQETQSEV